MIRVVLDVVLPPAFAGIAESIGLIGLIRAKPVGVTPALGDFEVQSRG